MQEYKHCWEKFYITKLRKIIVYSTMPRDKKTVYIYKHKHNLDALLHKLLTISYSFR